MELEESQETEERQEPQKQMAIPGNSKKHDPTSVVVTHLPTDISKREIENFFAEIGRVRRCHLVRDKDWQFSGMAYVQYVKSEDATRARDSLNRKQFMGNSLRIKFSRNQKKEKKKVKERQKGKKVPSDELKDEHYGEEYKERPQMKKKDRSKYDVNKDARKLRKGRIIIRNLSFKITDKVMEEHFSPYGKINEIQIMKKKDGKQMAGYAFLQYETRMQALKAIQECNMKPILGRPVVVDLAVPKKQFESQTIKVEDGIKEEVDIKEEVGGKGSKKTGKSFDDTDVKIKKEKLSDDEDTDSGLEDKDDSDSEGSDEDESDDDEDESDDDEDDSDDDDDDDDESEDDKKKKTKPGKKPVVTTDPSKDVAEERTVFIKNLNFDASEEDLASVLSKFGDLKYVLLCMDPLTEHPRGTAFAQFKEKAAAEACLAAESDPMTKDQFVVLGRPMHIMKAVSRGNLQDRRTQEESEKKVKDKRNLYLAREGFVRQGTQPALGVSQTDLNLRQMREHVKRRMLKNLNVFVSTTRLCINNLPEDLNDDELRQLIIKHREPGAWITEARVMRNLREIGDDGKPKSRGYGFVAFTKHEHALACLRKLNNNPTIFTPAKRPVIEFSLENREIIQAREKRLEKSKEKNPLMNKGLNAKQTQQKEQEGKSKKNSGEESGNQSSYMGSKSDPSAGIKNALPVNIGPKVRQRAGTGKITRKQLKKQRLDIQKGRKRLRTLDDNPEEPIAKKPKEETTTKKKNKKKNKRLPKSFKDELRRDKSFNDMVQQYKKKMASVNTESSSSKKWYED